MEIKKLRVALCAFLISFFALVNTLGAATNWVYCGSAGGSLTTVGNWHNTNCAGAAATTFTGAGDTWTINVAGSYTLSAAWTLGSAAVVNINSGITVSTNTFAIKTTGLTNVTLNVLSGGSLIVGLKTQFAAANKITLSPAAGSSVTYAVTYIGAIPNVIYSTLQFTASNTLNISTAVTTLINSATLTINSGNLTVGSVTNTGTILSGNNLTITTDLNNNTGSISVITSGQLLISGTITNFGTITGDGTATLVNSGSTVASLTMDQTTPGTTNAMLSVQNTGTGGITLTNALRIQPGGDISPTTGSIDIGSGLLTLVGAVGQTGAIGTVGGTLTAGSITSLVVHNPVGNSTNWTTMGVAGITDAIFQAWRSGFPITCASCIDGCCAGGGGSGNFTSITSYDETLTGGGDYNNSAHYVDLTSDANTIVNGQGYWVYMGNSSPNTATGQEGITTTGTPAQGNINLSFTRTDASNGYNLLANPYPSAISWSTLMANTGNGGGAMDGTAYIYDAADGSYGTIAADGTASGNYGLQADIIPTGMAFSIYASANGTLTVDETVKLPSGTQDLQRLSGPHRTLAQIQTQPRFVLQTLGTGMKSSTTIHFNPNASAGLDHLSDAPYFIGSEPLRVSTQIGGKDFSINGLPDPTQNYSIPVKMVTTTTGTYSISATNLQHMPSGVCLMLHDNYTNADYDLKNGPYAITLNDTETVARFVLNISSTPLTISTSSTMATCTSSNNGFITAVGANSGPWNYTWKDANNNIIKTTLNKAVADTLFGLGEGTFSVDVNTVGSCDNASQSFAMGIGAQPTLSLNGNTVQATCPTSNDAYIVASGTNAGPWNYNWKDANGNIIRTSDNKMDADTLYDLNSGVYTVEVNTVGNCDLGVQSFTLTAPGTQALAITTNEIQATCSNSSNGFITAIGNNAGPWNYTWKNGSNNVVQADMNVAGPDSLKGLSNGVYLVEVSTVGGCDLGTQSFTVTAPAAPTSVFSVPSSSVNVNTSVSFTNNSTNATSFWWTFGDGGTSSTQSPAYTYTMTGTNTVILYAYNAGCHDTVSSQQSITVQATTGISSVANSDIILSKDQNGHFVKFNYGAQTRVSINVYNALGQVIAGNINQLVTGDKVYLNLENAKDQLIFISISNLDKNTQVTKKLYNN